MSKATNQISLNPTIVARVLGTAAFLLVLASIVGQYSKYVLGSDRGLISLFYVDYEHNIPTYYSVFLILFAALVLALISILNRKRMIPHVPKWAILSLGFLFMSFDEAFSVHEKLIYPVRGLLGDDNLGIFYFAWVLPGLLLVFVLGIFFMRFLLHLPAKTRNGFLVAATFYIGGAIGIELIGGYYAELHGWDNWTFSLIATIEESFEMAGLITFIWALLVYCKDQYKEVHFRFSDVRPSGS